MISKIRATKRHIILFILLLIPLMGRTQIPRERANTASEPIKIFVTTNLGTQSTVETSPAGNLNVTIMHTFGIATEEPFYNFFGLDFGPIVRLGLDYGITDRWSVGIGRTSRDKVIDLRSKLSLIQQVETGPPLSITLKGNIAITTLDNGFEFADRLSYLFSLPTAKAISDEISIQLNPMYAHFNLVYDAGDPNDYYALGIGGQYTLNRRYGLYFETYHLLSDRAASTHNSYLIGLNIDTGGHVFQLFFTSAPWQTEQYVLYRNTDDFFAGDLRIGFNVNRVFGTTQ